MLRTFLKGLLLVAGLATLAIFLQSSGFFDRQIGNVEPDNEGGLITNEPRESQLADSFYAVKRSGDGQFYVNAWVENDNVRLMVDTGASFVVLSRETAANLGYDLWDEEFTQTVKIANGKELRVAPITIDFMEVGDGVAAERVQAVVSMEGDVDLLGMSFLRKIGGFSVSGDEMVFQAK